MKYGMFIGEMLADRTRRATLKDLQAGTHVDLFAYLREAMGEPSADLSKKYVVLWVEPPEVLEANILNDVARAFEHQVVENPLVSRFEEKGFQVDCIVKGDTLIFIEALAPVVERDVFVGNKAGKPSKADRERWWLQRDTGSYSKEFMQAALTSFLATGNFGVSWSGKTDESSPSESEPIRIGLGAYLRSMWTLLWTAILHPFTTTVIDLTTGKRIAELSVPFHEWEASLNNRQEEPLNG